MAVTQVNFGTAAPGSSAVVTATSNPIAVARWIGDDWQFEIAYLNPDGTPFDLTQFTTGGNLFNHSNDPLPLTGNFGETAVIGDPTQGLIYAVVFNANTTTAAGIIADATLKSSGQTRLQIYVTDGAGLITTILVQPIFVRQE